MCEWCGSGDWVWVCGVLLFALGALFSLIHKPAPYTGDYLGLDLKYHAPNQMYAPGTNKDGVFYAYRPNNELYGIEDGRWHNAGSYLGVDGNRHEANWLPGADGRYHNPNAYYNVVTGKFSDVKDGDENLFP